MVLLGPRFTNIVIVVALAEMPIYLRLIRTQVLSLRERTFVEAARANGDSDVAIAVRHVLPNALAPGLAQAPITLASAILVTAGLSFIGAGDPPPTPEWGGMIDRGRNARSSGHWWTSVFPASRWPSTVFGFAVVGEALQTIG